jgi:hypothetical protein
MANLLPLSSAQAPRRQFAQSSVRYFLPSAADLIFVVLLSALGASSLSSRLLSDAGIGWHIRNGELMWRTHSITRVDPFSATMHGRAWYAWEYLFDLVVSRLHDWAGLNGVTFFAALIIAAAFALALRMSVRRGAFRLIALPLLALAIAASSIHFFARPHILSWLLVLIWFQVLESDCGPTAARALWLLPLLMLLWVNVHGGFVLGFVLLGLYLLSALLAYAARPPLGSEHRQRAKKFAIILATCLIASLINPYGYRLHQHVFEYLSNRWLMNHIDEFRAPNFHGLPQQCFAFLLIIAMLSLALVRRKPPLRMVLVILFAAFSGLYAARNLPVASLLLVVSIAPVLSQVVREVIRNPRMSSQPKKLFTSFEQFAAHTDALDRRLPGGLWPLAAAVLALWICAHQGRIGTVPVMNSNFDPQRFPAGAVDFISAQQIREPVFSVDYWGGYLIYCLHAQAQVVVDDRHDLYGSDFMKKYLGTIRLVPEWNNLLEEQQVRWVLMPRQSALANMLRELPGWRLAYGDETAELFQKQ